MVKNRGVMLLYSIIVMTLLAMILAIAINQMQHGMFITKKFYAETKAEWAARTGLEYVSYKMTENPYWPFGDGISQTESFGKYQITKTLSSDKCILHGVSNQEEDLEFYIVFKNKVVNEGADCYSIAGEDFTANGSPIEYASVNSLNIKEFESAALSGDSDGLCFEVRVSENGHYTYLMPSSVYIAADGRCGAYKSVLERLICIDTSGDIDGGVYSGNNFRVDLHGKGAAFNVEQLGSGKPQIFAKNNFNIYRDFNAKYSRDFPVVKPCNIGEGTIYYGKDMVISDSSLERASAEEIGFKRKVGVNAVKMQPPLPEYPRLSWDELESKKPASLPNLDSGSYIFIPDPTSGDYNLFYFPTLCLDTLSVVPPSMTEEGEIIPNPARDVVPRYRDATFISKLEYTQEAYDKDFEGAGAKRIPPGDFARAAIGFPTPNIISWNMRQVGKTYKPIMMITSSVNLSDITVPGTSDTINGFNILALGVSDTGDKYVISPVIRPVLSFNGKFNSTSSLIQMLMGKKKAAEPVTLYTPKDSSVYIKGLLGGTGQIVTGSMAFEAGSNLETKSENHIAIYAAGDVDIKYVSARQTLMVDDFVLSAIAGETGKLDSIVNKALKATITFKDPNLPATSPQLKDSLQNVLIEYYGYSKNDARALIKNNIEVNALTSIKVEKRWLRSDKIYTVCDVPTNRYTLTLSPRAPSCFKGVIYTWGNFYADTDYGDFVMQGALVAFGGDPSYAAPGQNNRGSIILNDCTDFRIVYDPAELAQLFPPDPSSIRLNEVYTNRL